MKKFNIFSLDPIDRKLTTLTQVANLDTFKNGIIDKLNNCDFQFTLACCPKWILL